MFLRVSSLALFACALASSPHAAAQRVQTLHYAGTVGQQHVAMSLELADDAVTAGHYAYDAQKSEIRIVDSRVIGSTVVLQDEDGNILHLHFESAPGEKAGGWKNAALLEGTLDRGELDLPVKLTRSAEKNR
jgi:hypothetical protein